MERPFTLFPMKNNHSELPNFWVIIPAAGIGSRMKTDIPKQYLSLGTKTVLEHTIACFLEHPKLLGIIICLSPTDKLWQALPISKHPLIQTTFGGKERADSVLSGLIFLSQQVHDNDWVLVHDAARPNLQKSDLNNLLQTIQHDVVGGILAVPARDTLKQADTAGRVTATLDRGTIWQALTPQMFRLYDLQRVLQQALLAGQSVTDEASAMELAGYSPKLIKGRSDNIKITQPEDIDWLTPYFITPKNQS